MCYIQKSIGKINRIRQAFIQQSFLSLEKGIKLIIDTCSKLIIDTGVIKSMSEAVQIS